MKNTIQTNNENHIRIQYQSKIYDLPYTLIRSSRKSYSISVSPDAQITLRVPMYTTDKEIQHLLIEKRLWIITRYLEALKHQQELPVSDLTDTQRAALELSLIHI